MKGRGKVYCKHCYYTSNVTYEDKCQCTHPSNIDIIRSDTWFEDKGVRTYKERPSTINKNNDCSYYKEQEIVTVLTSSYVVSR